MTAAGDPWAGLDGLIEAALAEDLGRPPRDATTEALIDRDATGTGEIRARAPIVLVGLEAATRVFHALDARLAVTARAADGDRLGAGDVAALVEGSLRAILSGERTALNFLQRLSGVATLTARFVEAVSGTGARILDTRKTTPGWRALEKYAVRCGGGTNHRMGLHDAVLIKDNHIRAAGGVAKALDRARSGAPGLPLEIEVESIEALREALSAGAERVLLDNMDVATLREAVRVNAGRAALEASGGVRLENVREVAETGVDYISVGALTHSAPAADLSLEITRP